MGVPSFISSGSFDRILDVPKMGQKRDPFLNGTLREVGFGKAFAYKRWHSHSLPFYGFLLNQPLTTNAPKNLTFFKKIDIIFSGINMKLF